MLICKSSPDKVKDYCDWFSCQSEMQYVKNLLIDGIFKVQGYSRYLRSKLGRFSRLLRDESCFLCYQTQMANFMLCFPAGWLTVTNGQYGMFDYKGLPLSSVAQSVQQIEMWQTFDDFREDDLVILTYPKTGNAAT
jgi:hypothetical protein